MPSIKVSIEQFVEAVTSLKKKEKEELLKKLAEDEDFWEDIEDIATIIAREKEISRPYQEFYKELKREKNCEL